MKTNILRITIAALCFTGFVVTPTSAGVSFDMVTIGNPGNPNDTNDGNALLLGPHFFGSVSYSYSIAEYDTTNQQYTEFLNTVDPTGANSLALYDARMSSDPVGGIVFNSGAANGSKYSVKSGFANAPVIDVAITDVMRFVNWLENGQGNGSTETGAYTLSLGPDATRNAGAMFVIPTENEWYKAAYYDPTKLAANQYYVYGTHSDTAPAPSVPTAAPNSANYQTAGPGGVTDVGAYSTSASYYGAFDMAGNVFNFTETIYGPGSRIMRGGSFATFAQSLASSGRDANGSLVPEVNHFGFRVAVVPEPSSIVISLLGIGVLAARRRRDA